MSFTIREGYREIYYVSTFVEDNTETENLPDD